MTCNEWIADYSSKNKILIADFDYQSCNLRLLVTAIKLKYTLQGS